MTSSSAVRTAERTADHLSEARPRFFNENSYLVLRNRIPEQLLQQAGTAWIEQGMCAAPENPLAGDYSVYELRSAEEILQLSEPETAALDQALGVPASAIAAPGSCCTSRCWPSSSR